jgi:membrane associated rhomboid family serine protease
MLPLRDDTPCERAPIAAMALILLNVAAFGWQLSAGERSVLVGGAIPYELLTFQDVWPRDLVPPPLTVFTSMFLHGGLLHLGGNMLFLWIFGNNVEDALGRSRFLAFYLAAGVAAALAQTVATAVMASQLPRAEASAALSVPMVGASGAIAGVLAAYLVLLPRARVQTVVFLFIFFKVLYLPAWLFIGLWFLGQLVAVLLGAFDGVAVFAHIGGFLAGLALVRLVGRRDGWRRAPPRWAPS